MGAMSSVEQGRVIDLEGLRWVHLFGWIRPQELAWLLWPDQLLRVKNCERIVRRWLRDGLVLARPLPDHCGRALVLATAGARLLTDNYRPATSGKDIGTLIDGRWLPPTTWRHDLKAAGVLVRLHAGGWVVYPEREVLAKTEPGLKKMLDGLATQEGRALWIEVENARKSGPHLAKLARTTLQVVRGDGPTLLDQIKPREVLFAYDPAARDENGYPIAHKANILRELEKQAGREANFYFGALTMAGVGVSGLEIERVSVKKGVE